MFQCFVIIIFEFAGYTCLTKIGKNEPKKKTPPPPTKKNKQTIKPTKQNRTKQEPNGKNKKSYDKINQT